MKNYFTTMAFLIIASTQSFAQTPAKQWDYRFGGTGQDFLRSIQQTSDGGYILGGYSYSGISGDKTENTHASGWDCWIVKTDAQGIKQWDADFGGFKTEELHCIKQTLDGGYILGGKTESSPTGDVSQVSRGKADYWIVKTDAYGVKQWDARFGGSLEDNLVSLDVTSDGGYILAGLSGSPVSGDKTDAGAGEQDFWIVKTDSNGIKQWDAAYGGTGLEEISTIHQTLDGGYIIGGSSPSNIGGDKTQNCRGGLDYWVVKINASGMKEWDATFGGDQTDRCYAVQQNSDGSYLLGGVSNSGASGDRTQPSWGYGDYWIVKINSDGSKQWDFRYGGTLDDELKALQPTTDGGYILGGFSNSEITGDKTQSCQGSLDYWMVKIDGSGNKQWDERFGTDIYDECDDIIQTSDGGYLLGGETSGGANGDKTQPDWGQDDYWIIKTAADIPPVCEVPIGTVASNIKATSAKVAWDIVSGAQTYNVRYRITGTVSWTKVASVLNSKKIQGLSPSTEYDWQVKSVCDPLTNFSSDWSATQNFTTKSLKMEGENSEEEISGKIYPNPFTSSTMILFSLRENSHATLELFDLTGRRIKMLLDRNLETGDYKVELNRDQLATGIYFLKLSVNEQASIMKLVVE
jgi:hypothetical protein